jgi:DNA modification methylase
MRGELNQKESANGAPSVSALDSADYARHRWYFFKEGFSPAIVDHAVEDAKIREGALVVDPFCGSGTVPLQAALKGFRGHGIEVNPFLAFVARTKLASCSTRAFDSALAKAKAGAKRGAKSPLEGFSTFSWKHGAERWLFNRPVLRAFEGGWLAATRENGPAANLVKLCLLEAAMDACNAAKDGKCLRYKRDWEKLHLGRDEFDEALELQASRVREDIESAVRPNGGSRVEQGDVRAKELPDQFKLCITSPPYLNSFDYTDVYRPELFLGKFVTSMPQLVRLRLRTLRSHVQVDWPKASEHEYGTRYADSLRLILARKERLWDRRIPDMIKAYFEDMELVLKALRRKAAPTASAWIVVSTSAYAGVEIPVDLIIADIAGACGWYLREVNVLRYLGRLAGQQWTELSEQKDSRPHLRESVVILDAKPRRPSKKAVASASRGRRFPAQG